MDSHNAPLPNLVAGISDFQGGQILLEDPAGSHVIHTADGNIPATALDVAGKHAIFDAFRLRHQTAAWKGDRLVLVAFQCVTPAFCLPATFPLFVLWALRRVLMLVAPLTRPSLTGACQRQVLASWCGIEARG